MKQSARLLALSFPLLLLGCGIEAPRPALTPPRPTPQPPLSTLSVTLVIPANEIAGLINARSQEQIADLKDQEIKCPLGHCRLDLLATRTGPADVSAEDGQLAIRLPFRLNADLRTSGFLASLGKAQGDAQGLAVAATPISVGADWKLRSQLNGRIELSNAHLRVGPLITNVAQVWDQGGETLSRPIWHMLDNQISRIELKPQVEALWAQAFAPIAVGKKPMSWLVLRPQSVALMQPAIAHGSVALSLALAARGEVLVQDLPPTNTPTPLPKPAPLSEASNRFSIAIPFLLPYAEAEQLALSALKRNPPRVAGMAVNFSSLNILPSARDVVVETRFCAEPGWDVLGWFGACAHVYLRGVPIFDPVARTLRITDLHYDIASENAALKILRNLASAKIAEAIAHTMIFDVSRQIGREENDIREQLAIPHGKTLSISADVQSFGAPSFTWTRDGFLAFFSATGAVNMLFKP